jgi:adenosylcobinamide-phosphate synthase
MLLSFNCLVVLCAGLIEAAFGYPLKLLERIGHPVMWLGALLDRLESRLNHPLMPEAKRRLNGMIALALLLLASMLPALGLQALALSVLPGPLALVILALAASTLLAQASLYEHVAAVAEALEAHGLDAARVVVAKIVGRDTAPLDEAGIARAAIESLAENFSDGVVAPCLWGVVLGLPGMAGYKAVNTADSMIGHLTDRHADFGFAAARLDDWLNLPASRLAALWLALAAYVHPDASAARALAVIRKDARRHRSPNAGWPEAAMAGALNVKLAGPRVYHGTPTEDDWIGEGRSEATAADIRRALALYKSACTLQIAMLGVLAALIALI